MKILHVYKTYYPYSYGGVEKCIETLCETLAPSIQNEILCVADCHTTYSDRKTPTIKTYYPKTMEKFSCPLSLSLLKEYREKTQEYDLIHFHFPWPFADLLSLTQGIKKPYIITYHSDIIRQKIMKFFYWPLMKLFFYRAKKIIATSQNYLNSSKVLQQYKNKSLVIPIGLKDLNTATEQEKPSNFGSIKNKPYFLFVGVLRQYKGLHFLLHAMKNVTEYNLVIAGDGPCYAELQAIIKSENLQNVFLIGKVTDEQKFQLYKEAYAVVVPSHLRNEAYCYTLVEGLMFGKALISTELYTGTSFVNQHLQTGLVVPPADPKALQAAMNQFFFDKEAVLKYAANARTRFLEIFTADKMANHYADLYRQILTK